MSHDPFADLPTLQALRGRLETHCSSRRSLRRFLRERSRGRTTLIALAAGLAVAGGSAAAASLLSGQPSAPLAANFPGAMHSLDGSRYEISLEPDLTAGTIGWCTILHTYNGNTPVDLGTGGCGSAPTALGSPMFGTPGGDMDGFTYLLTASQVAAVHVAGGPTVLTRADPRLPFGIRAAVFTLPPRLRGHSVTFTALDGFGNPLPGDASAESIQESVEPLLPGTRGSCTLSGGRGARVVADTVVRSIVADAGIIGGAFLPCLNATIAGSGIGLVASVVLDARDPGVAPADLPGMTPLAGHPGVFDRQQAFPLAWTPPNDTDLPDYNVGNSISARRVTGAWLVVGGGTTAQRVAALSALSVGPIVVGRAIGPPAPSVPGPICTITAKAAPAVTPLSSWNATTMPIQILLMKRPGGRVIGAFRNFMIGSTDYMIPRDPEKAVVWAPCSQSAFLVNGWALEASLSVQTGTHGTPEALQGLVPVAGSPGVFTQGDHWGEAPSTWKHIGHLWLQVTGGSGTGQQEQLMATLGAVNGQALRSD
jgi:hypothetical protein